MPSGDETGKVHVHCQATAPRYCRRKLRKVRPASFDFVCPLGPFLIASIPISSSFSRLRSNHPPNTHRSQSELLSFLCHPLTLRHTTTLYINVLLVAILSDTVTAEISQPHQTNFIPMNRPICHRALQHSIAPSSIFAQTCAASIASPRSQFIASHSHPTIIQPTPRLFATMASATSFYDFKPLDSLSLFLPPLAPQRNVLTPRRTRPGGPPRRLQRQSRPRCQHGLQVRLHTAVRGPREDLQVHQGQVS